MIDSLGLLAPSIGIAASMCLFIPIFIHEFRGEK
jgi:hypothetical protein